MPNRFPFPRQSDDLPRAWALTGEIPLQIWERFSPAYEAQAETLWHAFETMGLLPSFGWAGSEDGEAILGADSTGEIVMVFHLEFPDEAQAIRIAIASDRLPALIADRMGELARPDENV